MLERECPLARMLEEPAKERLQSTPEPSAGKPEPVYQTNLAVDRHPTVATGRREPGPPIASLERKGKPQAEPQGERKAAGWKESERKGISERPYDLGARRRSTRK